MKYGHRVKFNGKWYLAGEDVPNDKGKKAKPEKKEEAVTEEKQEEAKEEAEDSETESEEETTTTAYTAESINEMSRPDLLSLAKEKGIKKYTTMSTDNLKAELIAVLGL